MISGVANVNWDRFQGISQAILSTITNAAITGEIGGSSLCNNATTNLGIRLTESIATELATQIIIYLRFNTSTDAKYMRF